MKKNLSQNISDLIPRSLWHSAGGSICQCMLRLILVYDPERICKSYDVPSECGFRITQAALNTYGSSETNQLKMNNESEVPGRKEF